MKTQAQLACEAFYMTGQSAWDGCDRDAWFAVAKAVRAAVIEECCAAIKATESFGSELDQLEQDIATLRSLK